MAESSNDVITKRPVNRASVDAHKRRMPEEVRAYQLRELREALGLTQVSSTSECSLVDSPDYPFTVPLEGLEAKSLYKTDGHP
jgi:hypothetical protein